MKKAAIYRGFSPENFMISILLVFSIKFYFLKRNAQAELRCVFLIATLSFLRYSSVQAG